jgi:hypothetical protein
MPDAMIPLSALRLVLDAAGARELRAQAGGQRHG